MTASVDSLAHEHVDAIPERNDPEKEATVAEEAPVPTTSEEPKSVLPAHSVQDDTEAGPVSSSEATPVEESTPQETISEPLEAVQATSEQPIPAATEEPADAPLQDNIEQSSASVPVFEPDMAPTSSDTAVEQPVIAAAAVEPEPIDLAVTATPTPLVDPVEFPEGSKSRAKGILSPEIVALLSSRRTSSGVSLLDCIRSALANPDADLGVFSGDAQCYDTFAELFHPLIEQLHLGFTVGQSKHAVDSTDV